MTMNLPTEAGSKPPVKLLLVALVMVSVHINRMVTPQRKGVAAEMAQSQT